MLAEKYFTKEVLTELRGTLSANEVRKQAIEILAPKAKGVWVHKIRQVIPEANRPYYDKTGPYRPEVFEQQVRAWGKELLANGFDHVLVKIVDGLVNYNQRALTASTYADDILIPFVKFLQEEGVMVLGWSWPYKQYPLDQQAYITGDRVLQTGVKGFVLNCEADFKGLSNTAFNAFMSMVILGGNKHPGIGYGIFRGCSTYRRISLHPEMPWEAILYGPEDAYDNLIHYNFHAMLPQLYDYDLVDEIGYTVNEYMKRGWLDPDGTASAIWFVFPAYKDASFTAPVAGQAEAAATAEALPTRSISWFRAGDGNGWEDLPNVKAAIYAIDFGEPPVEPPPVDPPPVDPPPVDEELEQRVTNLENKVAHLHEWVESYS